MWLIDTSTRRLEEFTDTRTAPPYAILSHTWAEEELTHSDLRTPNDEHVTKKKGYTKLEFVCDKALHIHHLQYAWIDTCCIDKSSSADLSEAINSMFDMYARAEVCFALLSDMPHYPWPAKNPDEPGSFPDYHPAFIRCRWFYRGWTLQELLAPNEIEFYDEALECFGTRETLMLSIQAATNIDLAVLEKRQRLEDVSVAKRMSWASKRESTRIEDQAYCLLGIFSINMPMLYGEGERAFLRLQDEILKSSVDHSIFAWDSGGNPKLGSQLLAPSPKHFLNGHRIASFSGASRSRAYRMTNSGLEITLPLYTPDKSQPKRCLAMLDCGDSHRLDSTLGLAVRLYEPPEEEASAYGPPGPMECTVIESTGPAQARLRGESVYNWRDWRKEATHRTLMISRVDESASRSPDAKMHYWFRINGRSIDAFKTSDLFGKPGKFNREHRIVSFDQLVSQHAGLAFETDNGALILISVGVRYAKGALRASPSRVSVWLKHPGNEHLQEQFERDFYDASTGGTFEHYSRGASWPLSAGNSQELALTSEQDTMRGNQVITIWLHLEDHAADEPDFGAPVMPPQLHLTANGVSAQDKAWNYNEWYEHLTSERSAQGTRGSSLPLNQSEREIATKIYQEQICSPRYPGKTCDVSAHEVEDLAMALREKIVVEPE